MLCTMNFNSEEVRASDNSETEENPQWIKPPTPTPHSYPDLWTNSSLVSGMKHADRRRIHIVHIAATLCDGTK